ncbi:MAG: translocation/assembly module TamB domain-containing protein [bacterium]
MKRGILKTTIIFIGFLLVILGFVYLTRTTRTLSRIMKIYVEVELKKVFDREVTVGKISTNIVNRITLQNVAIASEREVSEGVVLVCEKVTINHNPLLILLGKRDLGKSIVKIVLKSPHLFLSNRVGKWNFMLPATFRKAATLSRLPDIVIVDGKITIEDVKEKVRKIEIRDISGIVATKDRVYGLLWRERSRRGENLSSQIHFNFSGKSNQSQNDRIRLKGKYYKERRELSINLDIFDLDLANYDNLFLSSPNFRVLTGQGNLYLNLRTTLNDENYNNIIRMATSIGRDGERLKDFTQILSFSGELLLAELSCRWLSHTVKDIRGRIVFDNHRIGSQGIFMRYEGAEIKLRGGIERYLSQPALGLTLSANLGLFSLPEIVKIDGLKSLLPLEGSAKVSVDISGSLSDPKLEGWFVLPQAKIAGRDVEEFQGQFIYQDRIVRIINLQGKICEGTLVFSGKIDIDQSYLDLDFVLRSVDLASLVPPDWTDKAKGKWSLSGNIFGDPLEFQANGKINLREVKFLGANLGSVSGIFNYAKRKLEIEAETSENKYKLNTTLLLGREALMISRLEILAPRRAGMTLAGQIGLLGSKKLELTVLNSYAETGHLTWLAQRADRFSGRVNFLGKIGGTIGSPEVSGKVWSTGLKVMKEKIDFHSGVHYREKILKVTSFKLNNAYSANLTVEFDGKIPVVRGSMETTDGDLKLISTLFSGKGGKPREIGGAFRGEVDFSSLALGDSWWQNLKAKGAVSIVQAMVGQISFDELAFGFKITEQGLSFDKFHFSTGTGEVRGSAQMGMIKGRQNRIRIDTEWRNYPVNFSFWKQVKADADSKGKKAISWRRPGQNRVDGSLNFRGKLVWKKDWEIRGSLLGEDFKYNGEPLGPTGANLSLNRKLVHLSSFHCGNDLKGDFSIELGKEKTVTGSIEVDTKKISHFLCLIFGTGEEKSFLNKIKGNLYSKILFKGRLENPQIKGYVDIERGDFSTTNLLFRSTFNYDEGKINLELAELKFAPRGTVIARGKIDFNKLEPLEINVVLEHFDLSRLQSLFHDRNLKTFGEVKANLQLRGAFGRPRLKVKLESENSGVNSFKVDGFKTDFRVEKVLREEGERIELVFGSFSAGFGKSLLRLAPEGRIGFSLSRKLVDFSLVSEFRNLNFAKMSIFGAAELSGTANFSTNFPVLEVTLATSDLWVNRHNFGTVKLRLSYRDGKLFFLPVAKETFQLLGEIDLERLDSLNVKLLEFMQGKDRLITVNGNADFSGPIDLNVQGRKGKIAASLLGELLNVRIPLKGNSGFHLKLSRASIKGEKEKFYDSLRMEGGIDIANGSIGNLLFDDFNALFKVEGAGIGLKELMINKKGEYTVRCWGTIPYTKEGKDGRGIDFSLEMSDSKASILRVLSGEISDAKGELEAFLHITGESQDPLINGYFRIKKATLYCRQILKRIDDLTCDIAVKDSNIIINQINGKIEKGEMDLKGEITLAGWIPDKFDVVFENMRHRGIPLKIPFLKIPQSSFFGRFLSEVLCSLELKGKIHAYGSSQSYNLEGAIELENTHFTYPPRAEDMKDLKLDFLKPAVWNLEIKAGKNTWYENRFAEVPVQGDMRLTGPTKDLTVNGALTAVKGEISYLGATFTVKEATVECINNELFLQARGECPVEDDTIMLLVERGKWGKVKPKFISRSDPEMSQEKALAKATGLDSLRLSPQEADTLLRSELLKLIDSSLASPLIKSILGSIGMVDVVKVDTSLGQKTGEGLNSPEAVKGREKNSLLEGTKITLGKYLSNNLYLGYKLQFEERFLNKLELRHEVELLYRLKRGTSLRGKLGKEERYFGVERQIRF